MTKNVKNEQVMLKETTIYRRLLEKIDLLGRTVIELGVGTGVLTQLILDHNPAKVIGYEIDPEICQINDPRLELRIMDFTKEDFSYLKNGNFCLISNPPYSLLAFIKNQIIDRYHINNVIIMVHPYTVGFFDGYKIVADLPGSCFDPPTNTNHIVLKKGFGN